MTNSKQRRRNRAGWLPLALLLATVSTAGCDAFGGGGSTNTPEPPAKPEYERTFDEFADVPHQMVVQVAWAAEPIDEAIHLADEIAALRAKLDIAPEDFAAMCTVAFENGEVEIGAVTMAEDVKVEFEATLGKIKAVGQSLAGVPGRVKVASKAIGKMAMSTPQLALKSTKELSGELAVAVGDGGAQIEADLDTVKALPKEVKAEATAAKDVLATLPDKAVQATQNLMAAMKGEPIEAMETAGGEGEGEAEGEAAAGGTAVADAGAAGGAEPTDGGQAAASGAAAASGSASAGGAAAPTVAPPPSAGGTSPTASLPPDAIKRRVNKLSKIGKEAGDNGDWTTAADAFEEAYALAPDNLMLAFMAGDAANSAHDCERALVYLERFTTYGDPALFAPEIASANKTLGELKTFDCPPQTPDLNIARAATLARHAEALELENDYGGAAALYAEAYQLAPEDHAYAFHVAEASWNSRECEDAIAYFGHFASVGDARKHRVELKKTAKYQEQAAAGECPGWATGERESHARDLYTQAQALEAELDFLAAIDKYERAYYQLPETHALAMRIAESAWKAQLCDKAAENYRTFLTKTDPADPRYTSDLAKANGTVAKIDSLGCPNALYGAAVASSSSSSSSGGGGGGAAAGGGGGGAGDEKPPATAKGGGGSASSSSSVACAVDDRHSPAGGLAIGLLLLGATLRRRRPAR